MKGLYRLIECCINWRVVAGLGVVGIALFLLAPKLALASLPVLVVLVCPISMLFMMRSMGNMNMGASKPTNSTLEHLTHEQQMQLLEDQLQRVQSQQQAIRSQLPGLEGRASRTVPAVAAGSNGKVSRN